MVKRQDVKAEEAQPLLTDEDNQALLAEMEIDKFNLDEECVDQPRRFYVWGVMAAKMTHHRDKMKSQVKIRKAELSKKIRTNPDSFNIAKVTEAAINEVIEAHPDTIEAEENYLNAVRDASILDTAFDAFRDRRKQLELLSNLWLGGYWSDVKKPKKTLSDKQGRREQNSALKRSLDKRGKKNGNE